MVLLEGAAGASWASMGSSATEESKPEVPAAAAASEGAQELSQSPVADADESARAAANGADPSGAAISSAVLQAPPYHVPKAAGGAT